MEKDDKLEKYEEQKKEIIEMSHQIMSIKQMLDEFGDVQAELKDLNSKMAKLYDHGVIDNERNLVE